MLLHSIWCATHKCYFIIKSNNWYFRLWRFDQPPSVARKNALYTVTLEHGMLDKFQYSFFGNVFSPLQAFFFSSSLLFPFQKKTITQYSTNLSYSQKIYIYTASQTILSSVFNIVTCIRHMNVFICWEYPKYDQNPYSFSRDILDMLIRVKNPKFILNYSLINYWLFFFTSNKMWHSFLSFK